MRFNSGIIALLLVIFLAACGGGAGFDSSGPPPVRQTDGFRLSVLPESLLLGARADGFEITTEQQGRDILVRINAQNASRLRALYFDLDYDPEQFNPVTAEAAQTLGPREDILQLAVLRDRGTLHFGAVLTQPQLRAGMNGSGTVATAVFRREPAQLARLTSAAPGDPASALTLGISGGGDLLTWRYRNTGDYDQSGQVLATDLGPIGLNFLADAPDPNSALGCVDGNGDGRILATDLGPIGLFFQTKVTRYDVFSAPSADSGTEYPDGGTALKSVAFGDADLTDGDGRSDDAGANRLTFSASISPDAGLVYWVRPFDAATAGSVGQPSNMVSQGVVVPPPALELLSGSTGGSGTLADPYDVTDATDLAFSVTDPDGVTDATASAVFTVNPPAIGSVDASGALNVADGQTGLFNVSATLDGTATAPAALYFDLGGPPVDAPALSLVSGSTGGSGTLADPYTCTDSSSLRFRVLDTDGVTEIQTDPDTKFTVDPDSVGMFIGTITKILTLGVVAGTTGDFSVSCTCYPTNTPTEPPTLYFTIAAPPPPEQPFIMPAAGDPDWDGVPAGDGSEGDPYIMANGLFNPSPFLLEFSMEANTQLDGGGTPIDTTTLTWADGVPFTVTWVNTPNDGTFRVTDFTNSYIFATNTVPEESNRIYLLATIVPPI